MRMRTDHLFRRSRGSRIRKVPFSEVTDYLATHVAPQLGLSSPGTFTLVKEEPRPAVVRWETPALGAIFARVWRGRQNTHPILQQIAGGEKLRAAGLAVPDIVFRDDSWKTALRWDLEAVIEQSARGVSLRQVPSEIALPLVARDLARLHAQKGPSWNRPWLPDGSSSSPIPNWWQRRNMDSLGNSMKDVCGHLNPNEIDESLSLLKAGVSNLRSRQPALLHGDVKPGNIFLDDHEALTWIDFEWVHYGIPEWDIARVLEEWTAPGNHDEFLNAYAEVGGVPPDFEQIRTFFLLKYWKRLVKHSREWVRLKQKDADSAKLEFQDRCCKDASARIRAAIRLTIS